VAAYAVERIYLFIFRNMCYRIKENRKKAAVVFRFAKWWELGKLPTPKIKVT